MGFPNNENTMSAVRMYILAVALMGFLMPARLLPDPVAPREPKGPGTPMEEGGKGRGKIEEGPAAAFECGALVSFAGGSREKAVVVLPERKLTARYVRRGFVHTLREDMGNVRSIEFRRWRMKSSGKRPVWHHGEAVVTLADRSVFLCENIRMFDRITLQRDGKTYFAYTFFYGDQPVTGAARRGRGGTRKKLGSDVKGHSVTPHPDTVVSLQFLENGSMKGLGDILPFFFK